MRKLLWGAAIATGFMMASASSFAQEVRNIGTCYFDPSQRAYVWRGVACVFTPAGKAVPSTATRKNLGAGEGGSSIIAAPRQAGQPGTGSPNGSSDLDDGDGGDNGPIDEGGSNGNGNGGGQGNGGGNGTGNEGNGNGNSGGGNGNGNSGVGNGNGGGNGTGNEGNGRGR